ncbi:MAG: BREX-1 system phosphatase PglZ type A, partial [Acidobacteria bacterium]|nr:BREX-1 system phosphatase PglZ type A [Acidobacteriota bacterium]
MDSKQINDALDRVFNQEAERIVFWNDPDAEFREFVDRLPILTFGSVSVNILRLDQTSALEAKIRLEQEAPDHRFLVYSPTEEPDYEKDWLLDIRLFSRSFRADKASIVLDELGLTNQHLRLHLAERRKFFDNKERLQKMKSLVAADDAAADL